MISLSSYISLELITRLYTKRAEANYLGSGESGVNQVYPAKSSPVCIIFYVLNVILCASVEHLASNGL